MKYVFIALTLMLLISSLRDAKAQLLDVAIKEFDSLEVLFDNHSEYTSDGFDFPVGKPNAKGYYNAQQFLEVNDSFGGNLHLGEDWNGVGGGNTDLGDTVYAAANGYVTFSDDLGGGWGLVTRIIHQTRISSTPFVETLYGHFQVCFVEKGSWVKRGQVIGLIGNLNGNMFAHLHFELRSDTTLGVEGGYGETGKGYLNSTKFIRANRPQIR